MEIAIDRTRCAGHGLCAELLPELVRLDDWGYPIIVPGPVPAHLEAHARRAVAACPALALSLRPGASQQTPRFRSGSSQGSGR
jgi:ferredoxin